MKKVAEVLKKIYGYGIVIALFVGGASIIGYLVAMFIGGETATAICTFIYKKFFVWMIVGADIVVLVGLLAMYLAGEKSMVLETPKKANK